MAELSRGLLACLVQMALVVAAPLAAQSRVPGDPYTAGDDAALKAAGYVSLGPFAFGDDHTTRDVELLLGDEPIHWIETEHFRVGCAVLPLRIKDGPKEWRQSVRKELRRLRERLPAVPRTVLDLDPWLRTHLIAQRLEDCYGEIQRDLGVADADFPTVPMDPNGPPAEYYGAGPYLGMAQKFSVLIVRRVASNARYTRAYGGQESIEPLRLNFYEYGALGLCLSEETSLGVARNDEALHTHLVYNVVANLLNGYRGYNHDLPAWLTFGLAHWYSRRICPRYPAYERKVDDTAPVSSFWKWGERAQGLMRHQAFEAIEDLMMREDVTRFGMEQHIHMWFLVDYLMAAHREPTMGFLHDMKDPFHGALALPDHDELMDRQWERFRQRYGCDPAAIEAEWRKYPGQKRRKK